MIHNYLGIDLGGSSIKWTTVDQDGRTTEVHRLETPGDAEVRLATIREIAASVPSVRAICLGTAGPVDPDGTVQGIAVNLRGWGDRPLGALMQEGHEVTTIVKNDTNLAMYGEAQRGAAAGTRHALGVFIGTGIGGALLIDGRVYEGHHGLAGEIGHTVVEAGGIPCPCGQRGCVERYASVSGLRDRLGAGDAFSLGEFLDRAGDGATREAALYGEAVEALAQAIGGAITTFAPEIVVLGGGVVDAHPQIVEDLGKETTRFTLPAIRSQTRLVRAALGYEAGAVGAALYARSQGEDR